MIIRAGVLSDTHLIQASQQFRRRIRQCFQHCDIILHAGDLTDLAVLEAFTGKTVYAVHGNMCGDACREHLPASRLVVLGGFRIGLCHGDHLHGDLDLALWSLFPEVDCIVYGHTHRQRCERLGPTLFLNPGSFQDTGPHGASAGYAILEAGVQLQARLCRAAPQS